MNNFNEQLNDLSIEDIIWVIYFFLAISALISNYYERKNLLIRNTTSNYISHNINITIFVITLFIYIYFVYTNYRDFKNLKREIAKKQVLLSEAKLIAALLFLVGGIIYLITEIADNEETEIAII